MFLEKHVVIRRLMVLAMYGAYFGGEILQWRQLGVVHRPVSWIILSIFLLSFSLGAILFGSTRYGRWGMGKDKSLDERELAVRNAIYKKSYSIVVLSSVFGLIIWYMPAHLIYIQLVDSNVFFWGWVLFIATLPSVLLAWVDQPTGGNSVRAGLA
jgi:hypothetical protein